MFPLCKCERWLVRLLVVFVLLVALGFGGLPNSHAGYFDDFLSGGCPVGETYRGFHRDATRCSSCVNPDGSSAWYTGTYQGERCVQCGRCPGGQFFRACPGDDGYPMAVCVENPQTADDEEDEERLGDILANIGGDLAAGGNPWAGGAGGAALDPLELFGSDVGEVEADDLVPQADEDGDGDFECPRGTTLVEEGDNAGLCEVTDQCAFYGAAGTWPDCSCAVDGRQADDRFGARNDWPIGWFWDRYALRCVPREGATGSLRPWEGGSQAGGSYMWNLVCGGVSNTQNQNLITTRNYLTRASPVFTARRGGIEVLRYGAASTISLNLGAADWVLSTDEESDESTFGKVICSWLAPGMTALESSFAGWGISRAATRCPALTIPFFRQDITFDFHCYLVGRFLGLIQALAVISYSFLAVRSLWGGGVAVGARGLAPA